MEGVGRQKYDSSIYLTLELSSTLRRLIVNCMSREEINYDKISHLEQREGCRWPVTQTRDGTEICATSGAEVMRKFGLAHHPDS
jgi:hypothetical protein